MRKQKAKELVRFGENVRKLRDARDWTQEQLAEKADLDQTSISGIERVFQIGTNETHRPWSRSLQTDRLRGCRPRTLPSNDSERMSAPDAKRRVSPKNNSPNAPISTAPTSAVSNVAFEISVSSTPFALRGLWGQALLTSWLSLDRMKPAGPTFIDLFCGCGGFTLGMLRAGFPCLAAIDFNAEAVATLKANLVDARHAGFEPPTHALERDLTKYLPQELAALVGTDHIDMIVGGPPCQGFSTARQRDGSNHGTERFKEDSRRYLYRRFLDHVGFFQPRVFVIENVLGLRTAAGGRYFTAVQHEARILGRDKGRPGYRVHAQIEDAPKLGVPQKRRRQFIIGVRNDLPGYFTSEFAPAKRAVVGAVLGDAICDLPSLAAGEGEHERDYDLDRRGQFLNGQRSEFRRPYLFDVLEAGRTEKLTNHVARPHSDRDLRDFALLPEGQSSAKLMRSGVEFEFPYDRSTFKDRYTRQHRRRPCSTIVAHLSKDGLMFIHPTQNRSLTPREAARVQSFPDWFVFPRTRTHAFRLIGNAVPPLVAESVGVAIRGFFASSVVAAAECPTPRCNAADYRSIPSSVLEAKKWLAILVGRRAHQLRKLPDGEFLRGWHALLWLFPGLHPDGALDHGGEVVVTSTSLADLSVLSRRYARSGWPVALELVGREAWRRHDAGELSDEVFYCVAAQVAGLKHRSGL